MTMVGFIVKGIFREFGGDVGTELPASWSEAFIQMGQSLVWGVLGPSMAVLALLGLPVDDLDVQSLGQLEWHAWTELLIGAWMWLHVAWIVVWRKAIQRLRRVKEEQAEAENKLQEAVEKTNGQTVQLQQIINELQSAEQQLDELKNEKIKLDWSREKAEQEIEEIEQEVERKQARLREVDSSRKKAEQEKIEFQKEVEQEKVRLRAELEQEKAELDSTRRRAEQEAEQQKATLLRELELSLRSAEQEAEQQKANLRSKVESLREKAEREKEELQRVKEEKEAVEQKKANEKKELDLLQQEIYLRKEAKKREKTKQEMGKSKTVDLEKHQIVVAKFISYKKTSRKKQEEMQLEIWRIRKHLAEGIRSTSELRCTSKLAHGCDGIVFACASGNVGLEAIALKILFNMGIATPLVEHQFRNEYEILKQLPLHANIIPILNEFKDRPANEFISLFPTDIKQYAVHPNGKKRKTMCILMPILKCFSAYFYKNFHSITPEEKIAFISDVLEGLCFLFEHDVVHRDMKLDNLLLSSNNRIIITDFGHSVKLSPAKKLTLKKNGSLGGNSFRMAPEIIASFKEMVEIVEVDYSKQPSFELGMLSFEIYFGQTPGSDTFGEQMDDSYFQHLCLGLNLPVYPELFQWIRGLLMKSSQARTDLFRSKETFYQIEHLCF